MNNKDKETLISKYLGMSIDLRRELLKKGQGEISELISFIVSLMGTLGIIAGFGFTAYQFILSPVLFFVGEVLVIGTIIYLTFKTKDTLIHYAVDTEGYINYWVQKATEIRGAMIEKSETNKKIEELENELLNNMMDTNTPPKFVGATAVKNYLNNSVIFSTIGISILILSFIICF